MLLDSNTSITSSTLPQNHRRFRLVDSKKQSIYIPLVVDWRPLHLHTVWYNDSSEHQQQDGKTPEKILDAPDMKDDFYLNVLDWSYQNMVAIGLARSVYLWNADDGPVRDLKYTRGDMVTSLSWSGDGNFLALGDRFG